MLETGDIVIVDLLPVVGHEQGSSDVRPCLVVTTSLDRCDDCYEMLTIVPFTTTLTRGCGVLTPVVATPTLNDQYARSRALLPQVRSIGPRRIMRKASPLSAEDLDAVKAALKDYLKV